jgi:hypothetical protein
MSESKHSADDNADDARLIALPDYMSPRTQITPAGVKTLDLARAEGKDGPDSGGAQEDEILVVFDLPDGSQSESKFKYGQTVEFVKSFVESEFGIPMPTQVLRFQGKVIVQRNSNRRFILQISFRS